MDGMEDLSSLILGTPVMVPERRVPVQEHIPQTMGEAPALGNTSPLGNMGLGALDSVFGLFETKILGIPIWAIGAGVAAYFIFFNKKTKEQGFSDNEEEAEEDYGYKD